MLPKSYRLPSSQIVKLRYLGKRVNLPQLQLIYQKSPNPVSRFAIIVPLKTDKRATARNRAKRLARESLRHLLPGIKENIDAVILVKQSLVGLKQAQVEEKVKTLLAKTMEQ